MRILGDLLPKSYVTILILSPKVIFLTLNSKELTVCVGL